MRSKEQKKSYKRIIFILLFLLLSTSHISVSGSVYSYSNIKRLQSETNRFNDEYRIWQTSPLNVENYSLIKQDQDNDTLADAFQYSLAVVSSLEGNYTFTTFVSSQDALQINANVLNKTSQMIRIQHNRSVEVVFRFSAKELARNALWGNLTIGTFAENKETGHLWWLLTSEHRIEKESLDYNWGVKIGKLTVKTFDSWGTRRLDGINITLEVNVSKNIVPESIPIFAIPVTNKKSIVYLKTEVFQNNTQPNGSIQITVFSPYLKPLFDNWEDSDLKFRIVLGPFTLRDEIGEFLAFETKEIPKEFALQEFDSSRPSLILDGKIFPQTESLDYQLVSSVIVIVQVQIMTPIPYQLDIRLDVTETVSQQFRNYDRRIELRSRSMVEKSQAKTFEYQFSFSWENTTSSEVIAIRIEAEVTLSLPNSFTTIDQVVLSFSRKASPTISLRSLPEKRMDINQAVIGFPFLPLSVLLVFAIVLGKRKSRRTG